jgi:hypothetical protein
MRVILPELNKMLLHKVFDSSLNMVFNLAMSDQEIINGLGGPAKVAELLGLNKTRGGVQRVQNWITRGIPAQVKLDRPDLFLRGFDLETPNASSNVLPCKA